jgi:hypothetical protein
MAQALKDLRKKVVIGFVGGSDLVKQKEQLGEDCNFSCHVFRWIDLIKIRPRYL